MTLNSVLSSPRSYLCQSVIQSFRHSYQALAHLLFLEISRIVYWGNMPLRVFKEADKAGQVVPSRWCHVVRTQCQDEVGTYSAGTHILKVVKWG